MPPWLREWSVPALLVAAVAIVVGVALSTPRPAAGGFVVDGVDGRPIALADYAGQTVILNFWASWCGPCRAEVPELARFAADHPEVAVIGLAVDSGPAGDVRVAARQFGITWPVAIADAGLRQRYGVEVLPTTVILGPDGAPRSTTRGLVGYDALVRATRAP